jgi:hypothetical protein
MLQNVYSVVEICWLCWQAYCYEKSKPDNFHLFSSFQLIVWAQSVDPLLTADPKFRISRFSFPGSLPGLIEQKAPTRHPATRHPDLSLNAGISRNINDRRIFKFHFPASLILDSRFLFDYKSLFGSNSFAF